MNYYIQGDSANADKINAAFKKLGYDTSGHLFNAKSVLYFTLDGEIRATTCNCTPAIIKTHPDYKELELPVEQLFKVGDWIVRNDNGTVSQITKTINGKDEYGEYRAYEHTNGYFAECFENEYHPWTIQDAKDGDVLAAHECYVIFKEIDGLNIKCHCTYHYMGFNPSFHIDTLQNKTAFNPATKEQRDLLFAKMKKAGYEWDADKKELKKIQFHYDIANFHAGMPVLVRDGDYGEWKYVSFSHYRKVGIPFCAGGQFFFQCIPFNNDTKHLLGTTGPCDECYINW